MGSELRIGAGSGNVVYAHVLNSSSRRWNGSTFEVYSSVNYLNYGITMTEQGTSGVYVGDFPSTISDAATYEIFYYIRQGGANAEGDPVAGVGAVTWTGTSVSTSGDSVSGEMSASDFYDYVIRIFKRTDKTLDFLDAVNECIGEIRRDYQTSREEKETALTAQITVLGQYKMDIESDFSMFVSDVFIRDSTNGKYLTQISKSMFDALYSHHGTESSMRRKPIHWCYFAGQVLVGPVPDSIDYTYVMSYSKDDHVSVSMATTSVPFTTTPNREMMKSGTLYRLFSSVGNDGQAQKYLAFWNNGLVKMDARERKNRAGVVNVAYSDI